MINIKEMLKKHKRSVLRKQSRDTNRNIKRSVYCQYGFYSLMFRALALREMAQIFISEIEWLAAFKCRATGLFRMEQ